MHSSMTRLYHAAQALRGIKGQAVIARLLGEKPQTLKNWEARGVSAAGAIKAQEFLECNAVWLMGGRGNMQFAGAARLSGEDARPADAVLDQLEGLARRNMLSPSEWHLVGMLPATSRPRRNADSVPEQGKRLTGEKAGRG